MIDRLFVILLNAGLLIGGLIIFVWVVSLIGAFLGLEVRS